MIYFAENGSPLTPASRFSLRGGEIVPLPSDWTSLSDAELALYGVTRRPATAGEEAAALEEKRAGLVLSPLQLAKGLHAHGLMTAAEARAFASIGTLPPAMAQQIGAAMTLSGMTADEKEMAFADIEAALEYRRVHPLVALLAAALGLSEESVDAIFISGLSS